MHQFKSLYFVTVISLLSITNANAFDVSIDAAKTEIDKIRAMQERGQISMDIDDAFRKVSSEKSKSVNTILKYAQKGNSDAQNIIGYWYSTGVLTVGDPQESAKRANQWFLSASKTNPVAAYNIANSYATGRGFPSKDMEAAVPYYEYAAKNGQINQAAVRLAFWFYQQKDYDQAQEWAKTAAGKNKKYGDFLLGKMLLNGQGISKDNQAAISTLTISVEGYNSASARLMAWAYSNGQAGQKNMQLSCAYEKIANQIGGSGNPNNANVFCNNANEADRAAGESFARNWFANHQKPAPVDYVSALSGREPQFASR